MNRIRKLDEKIRTTVYDSNALLISLTLLIIWISFSQINLSAWGAPFLREIQIYSVVLIELLFLYLTSGNMRILSLTILSAGTIIYFAYGLDFNSYITAYMRHVSLITLIAFVPTLAMPFEAGGFQEALTSRLKGILQDGKKVYRTYLIASGAISALLNMAAIPVLYQSTSQKTRIDFAKELSLSFGRGYSAAAIWSPNIATLALILSYQGLSWVEYFPVGLLLSVCILLVAYFFYPLDNRKTKISRPEENKANDGQHKMELIEDIERLDSEEGKQLQNQKLIRLTAGGISFILILILFDSLFKLGILLIAPICATLFSLLCLLLLRKGRQIPNITRRYMIGLPKRVTSQVGLFCATGVLASSLQDSGLGSEAANLLLTMSKDSPIIIGSIVIFGTMLLSIFGLHPIVSIGAFAATLNPQTLGISAYFLTGCLICAYSASVITSPFTATTVMLSAVSMKSPLVTALVRNFVFTVVMSLVVIMVLAVMFVL